MPPMRCSEKHFYSIRSIGIDAQEPVNQWRIEYWGVWTQPDQPYIMAHIKVQSSKIHTRTPLTGQVNSLSQKGFRHLTLIHSYELAAENESARVFRWRSYSFY